MESDVYDAPLRVAKCAVAIRKKAITGVMAARDDAVSSGVSLVLATPFPTQPEQPASAKWGHGR
jgi:hypothetical protein